MNEWAKRRKRNVRLVILGALIVLIGVPYLIFSFKPATCSDGKMNGDESGVDCGGSCQLLCTTDSLPIITKGDPRLIVLATSSDRTIMQAVVQVENPNTTGELPNAPYVFNIYTSTSTIPKLSIKGSTYVPRQSTFIILEGPFEIPSTELPARVTFSWQGDLDWQKKDVPLPILSARNITLNDTETSPKAEAEIFNQSSLNAKNVDVVVTVLDKNGNIMAVSRTYLEELKAGESLPVIFTWPRPFSSLPLSGEIYLRVFPDRSFLK